MAWGWVVVVGSFSSGLKHVYGPLPNEPEAQAFVQRYADWGDGDPIVMKMESPDHEADRDDMLEAYLSEALELLQNKLQAR